MAPLGECWMPMSGTGGAVRWEQDTPWEGIGSWTTPSSLLCSLDLFSHCTAGNREIYLLFTTASQRWSALPKVMAVAPGNSELQSRAGAVHRGLRALRHRRHQRAVNSSGNIFISGPDGKSRKTEHQTPPNLHLSLLIK